MGYERGGKQRDRYGPDDVEEVPCPDCGRAGQLPFARESGSLDVVRCACGLLFTSPRPREPERNYWGDAAAYEREARLVFEGRRPHHRDPNYLEELDFIARHAPRGRFLDVGCNMGMLLRHARARGWDAWGVEPSPSLSGLARERLGLNVLTCYLAQLPDELRSTFDVVALSDVFEHVTDPLEMLAAAARALKPGGILYVKVPNARFTLLKHRFAKWRGRELEHGTWDAYEHVVHYTDRSLARMLAKGNFVVVDSHLPRPVQVPVWHHLVGHYFQYPTPWILDWKRHAGRVLLHRLGQIERALRGGGVGHLPPSIGVIARREASLP